MKLTRANSILSKLYHFVPNNICISVYYYIFYTHLINGCLVWSYSKKSSIFQIINLQKWCIQIINFSDFNSLTDPQFSELKLLKAINIFSQSKFLLMFDFIQENIPEHSYETHFSQMFYIPKGETSQFPLNNKMLSWC